MYTLFLKLILKNDNNSNVIIDKKNQKALNFIKITIMKN